MPIDPVVDVQGASESVLITQWRNSPRFKALLSGIVQVLQDKIIDPFLIMERALNPDCLLYTSPSPRDRQKSRMPSSA